MQSSGQEALESQVLWDSTTEGLRTCEYLSHILTKPFLFSKHWEKGELRKEMLDPKKGNEICNVTARLSGDSFLLIKGLHHNVHKPVHLQRSVQRVVKLLAYCKLVLSLPSAILCRSSLIDPIRPSPRGDACCLLVFHIGLIIGCSTWMRCRATWQRANIGPLSSANETKRMLTCGNSNLSKPVLIQFCRSLVWRNIQETLLSTVGLLLWHSLY